MFETLSLLPVDPILGLMQLYRNDSRVSKVDLGVGVYKNDQGLTPVLSSVQKAEARLIAHQTTKSYVAPAGSADFIAGMSELVFGDVLLGQGGRLAAVQTPGGCGALRIAAELIRVAKPDTVLWVSDPTWGNHIPLLGNAGLSLKKYPYLDSAQTQLDWPAMQATLLQAKAGDVVLLHACCHNPSGVDLSMQQWQWLTELCLENSLLPFVDMAYQGFGVSVDEDACGLRYMASKLPEMLVAVSCSKNFGLYRERVGLVAALSASQSAAAKVQSHFLSIVRGIYSMPPNHGAEIVANILSSEELKAEWLQEVAEMRTRISDLRVKFVLAMQHLGYERFNFVVEQKGMFSFLGLTATQVEWLAQEKGIYMLSSSRASIAGLTQDNVTYVCSSVVESLSRL
ncbi:MAG: amino acid aminotransferase [Marinagarivorans sp.]|nr:amino acid aminotransferase [Marinagarivorans sp.]